MDARAETDLLGLRAGPVGEVAGERPVGAHASMVAAVLDLVRAPGGSLRVLELASEAGSLTSLAGPDEIVALGGVGPDANRNGNGNGSESRNGNGIPATEVGPAGDGNGNTDRSPGGNGEDNGTRKRGFDCAVAIDAVHRLGAAERRRRLARLRRAARGLVVVEAPRAGDGENPLDDAIELFREYGDSVLVLSAEHLPAVLTMAELRRAPGGAAAGAGPGSQAISQGLLAASSQPPRSLLISIVDPEAPGIDVSALQWCCSPAGAPERDPASLALLPLSLEIRRLSDRLELERADAGRVRAEADDMRRKLADLTRIASEDRRARENAELQVEIIAAARGYRIGLAFWKVRAATRRRLAAGWRLVTAPARATARLLRGGRGNDR